MEEDDFEEEDDIEEEEEQINAVVGSVAFQEMLKLLPVYLKYAYLGSNHTLPIIIATQLTEQHEISLLQVLERDRQAIGWTIADIRGISPSFCMHPINMGEEA